LWSASVDKQMEVWTATLLLIAVLEALVSSPSTVPGVSGAQGLLHINKNCL
jgi:hypothetical protein